MIFAPSHAGARRRLALAGGALGLALARAASAASFEAPRGNGTAHRQTRAVDHFDALTLALPGTLELRLGDTESVSVETDDNLQGLIDIKVEDGTLKIGSAKRGLSFAPGALKFVVRAKSVERLSVDGSGAIDAPALRAPALRFNIGGSGSITVGKLASEAVSVAIGGSGSFKAGGATDRLDVSIGGSGQAQAGGLAAKRVNVSMGGSGQAVVWARQALNVSIAGSGDVGYYGDPQLSRGVAGSGRIKRLGAAPD
ncbi:MAG TPA: DUF2807 domain-containing protein [Janthinobacterium sp.]|nr:DUF2807 domain-containing protein [Janthinobacterium sp.]